MLWLKTGSLVLLSVFSFDAVNLSKRLGQDCPYLILRKLREASVFWFLYIYFFCQALLNTPRTAVQPSDNKLIVLLLGNSAFKTRAVMKMRLELIGSFCFYFGYLVFKTFCISTEFPERQTIFGKVRGRVSERIIGSPVEEYLGIPFASPPVGAKRFQV